MTVTQVVIEVGVDPAPALTPEVTPDVGRLGFAQSMLAWSRSRWRSVTVTPVGSVRRVPSAPSGARVRLTISRELPTAVARWASRTGRGVPSCSAVSA